MYLNLVLMNNQSIPSLEKYANFLTKAKKFDTAYEIYKKIGNKSNDPHMRLILCMFMIQRGRSK